MRLPRVPDEYASTSERMLAIIMGNFIRSMVEFGYIPKQHADRALGLAAAGAALAR